MRKRDNKEFELLCKFVFENIRDGLVIVDSNGKIVCWNKAAESIFGYNEDEVVGKHFWELIVPEKYRKFSIETFKSIKENSAGRILEAEALRKDGSIIPVEVSLSVLKAKDESYVVAFIRDISERIMLEEKLEETREIHRLILENISDVVVMLDKNGTVIFVSPAVREYGYEVHEVVGKNFLEFIHPDDREEIEKIFKSELRMKSRFYEFRVITKSGDVRYIQTISSPIYKNGELFGFVGVVRDITEFKKVKSELEESEQRFKMLAERSLVGTYIIQDGVFVYVNPKFAEIYGYEVEEILGKNPVDFAHPDDKDLVERNIRLRMEGKIETANYTFRIIRKDGAVRTVEVFGLRMIHRGRPAIIGTLIDITEKIEMEENLRRLNRLLTAVSEVNQLVVRRLPKETLLRNVCRIVAKTGDFVFAWAGVAIHGYIEPVAVSGKMIARKYLRDSVNICRVLQESLVSRKPKLISCTCGECLLLNRLKRKRVHALVLPLHYARKLYGVIELLSDRELSDEEVRNLTDMARNVSLSLRHQEVLQQRKIIAEQVKRNLEQFETLADKLRNPLAIIKGYLEIKKDVDQTKILAEIEKQVARIEEILNELRGEEMRTYHLKKLLRV